jgi:hypothetical protein
MLLEKLSCRCSISAEACIVEVFECAATAEGHFLLGCDTACTVLDMSCLVKEVQPLRNTTTVHSYDP